MFVPKTDYSSIVFLKIIGVFVQLNLDIVVGLNKLQVFCKILF